MFALNKPLVVVIMISDFAEFQGRQYLSWLAIDVVLMVTPKSSAQVLSVRSLGSFRVSFSALKTVCLLTANESCYLQSLLPPHCG